MNDMFEPFYDAYQDDANPYRPPGELSLESSQVATYAIEPFDLQPVHCDCEIISVREVADVFTARIEELCGVFGMQRVEAGKAELRIRGRVTALQQQRVSFWNRVLRMLNISFSFTPVSFVIVGQVKHPMANAYSTSAGTADVTSRAPSVRGGRCGGS